jgi:hypothetical protein
MCMGMAEPHGGEFLRPSHDAVPACRPMHKPGCALLLSRACRARGRGNTRHPPGTRTVVEGARAGGQATRRAQGDGSEARLSVHRRRQVGHAQRASCRLIPFCVQFGAGLTRAAPAGLEKAIPSKRHWTLEHILDRPAELVSQEAQGFAWVRFVLQAGQELLRLRGVAHDQGGGFREGPCAVGGAHLLACRAQALTARFLAAFPQAARRGEVLHTRKPVAVVDCVKHHAAEDWANAGDGLQEVEGLGSMGSGGFEDGEFEVLETFVIRGAQRPVDLKRLWHRGLGTAFGAAAVGLGGDLFAALGSVVLSRGRLPVPSTLGVLAPQGGATPSESTGSAPRGRRDGSLREPAASEHHGDLCGIDLVMFGLTAVESLHREGMTEDTGNAFLRPEVGKPVPGEQARNRNPQTVSIRGNGRPEFPNVSLPLG